MPREYRMVLRLLPFAEIAVTSNYIFVSLAKDIGHHILTRPRLKT
jgi:hypothetical protein